MSKNLPVQLGLCCMNTTLKKEYKVYCSRKIIIRVIEEKGMSELKNRICKNLQDLFKRSIKENWRYS